MKQEDKELLFKDLCARLPYSTLCYCKWAKDAPNGTSGCIEEVSTYLLEELEIIDNPKYECQICEIKPYLRPMSSMTKAEVLEYISLKESIVASDGITYFFETYKSIDWLNKKMFDYRKDDEDKTMIEKGLALEAQEGMYK